MTKVDVVSSYIAPMAAEDLCAEAYDRFTDDSELVAIPVLAEGRPIGLLKRVDFLVKLADRFGRPLFERRPVTVLMDAAPLMVEAGTTVEDLNALLLGAERTAIQQGFLVVEKGLYKGVGTAATLLEANMRRANERMAALEHAQVEAEAANRAKSNFLANMSHELRTPLNAIIGFSEFIIEGGDRGLPAANHAHYVRDIRDSGKHLLNVINSILDMSKLEANAFELREDYAGPGEIVDQAVRIMEPQAIKAGVEISVSNACESADVFADLQVMRQIMLNLLSNAVKFSPANSRVHVQIVEDRSGGIVFIVRDFGAGMTEQDLERAMKPFVQVDGAKSRRHEGTGLGLPLVNAFTNALGGSFRLESEKDVGTTAFVTLPSERCYFQPAGRLAFG